MQGASEGWALEIKTFLGPEMAMSEASAIWAQKSLIEYKISIYEFCTSCISVEMRRGVVS